jgi:hypothetical protein
MRYVKVLGLAALGVVLACSDTSGPSAKADNTQNPQFTVAGAGFTTINEAVDNPDPVNNPVDLCANGPGIVNCNLYNDKAFVWINGGPNQTGPSALSDGVYFFTVLEPSGQHDPNDGGDHVLSDTDPAGGSGTTGGGDSYLERRFSTSGGDISSYLGSTHDTHLSLTQGLLIRLLPYDDTSNPGGVYIMAICRIDTQASYDATLQTYDPVNDPVDPAECKYDAFKAPTGDIVIIEFPDVSGLKYYDANTNGQFDAGEVGIAGWLIDFTNAVSGTVTTDATGAFTLALVPDIYTFQEQVANAPWIQTGNTVDQSLPVAAASLASFIYTVTVGTDNITGLNFGNVCVGAGGGHTLGFWSNKNGKATLNDGGTLAPELALLAGLNLRRADGSAFDPTTYNGFRTWLLDATATNMAYMLSAQLAAMALNVEAGFVNAGALIYAPGTTSANGAGFATVGAVMTEANTELGIHGLVLSGSPFRAYQEALKNALDQANNNLNFVQPGPSSCPTPVFP